MRNKKVGFCGGFAIALIALMFVVTIFCVAVLVYGQCNSLSFVEVLQNWFPFCFA